MAIEKICFDSREVEKFSLFVAVTGTQVDGHKYIDKAIEDGAVSIVCEVLPENIVEGVTYIRVQNSALAMGFIAANFFDNPSSEIKLVGITGTNGKTTTKELINEVLKRKFKTTATQGNLNNHIGVPLTLLAINSETEFGIVEMGANHPGEIKILCEI